MRIVETRDETGEMKGKESDTIRLSISSHPGLLRSRPGRNEMRVKGGGYGGYSDTTVSFP